MKNLTRGEGGMEKYIIGEKFDKKFDFRATCFGILRERQ